MPKFTYRKQEVKGHVIIYGYKELQSVYRQVRKSKKLTLYLGGYFFFMMGLLTVMYMAATFGVKEIGLKDDVLIPTVLVINLVGMFGAWFFARLSGKVGNLPALDRGFDQLDIHLRQCILYHRCPKLCHHRIFHRDRHGRDPIPCPFDLFQDAA